ncbi:MAG: hypothetical protein AAGK14_05540 [Verrucomicrobiota bacterium]
MSSPASSATNSIWGWVGWTWALAGILTILLVPIYRLSLIAWDAFFYKLMWWHWAATLAWLLFMIYAEGWRGFHRAWAPRTAARAHFLLHHPTPLRVALAPLFCMCFFEASRKRKIVAWVLTGFIIALVLIVGVLPQPWRGLIDLGVVVGLSMGVVSFLFHVLKAFYREPAAELMAVR